MFKIFIMAVLAAFIGLGFYLTFNFFKSMCKKLDVSNIFYRFKEKLIKKPIVVPSFEEKLISNFKQTILNVLIKQAKVAVNKKHLIVRVNELISLAKEAKEIYEKTHNIRFQEKAYEFIKQIQDTNGLIELANSTLQSCKDSLDTLELEYQTIISNISNKKIELNLLNTIGDESMNKNIYEKEFNDMLTEYANKIDSKRLDVQINENVNKKLALEMHTIDLTNLNSELKVVYEKL